MSVQLREVTLSLDNGTKTLVGYLEKDFMIIIAGHLLQYKTICRCGTLFPFKFVYTLI